jgi:hypothetical protein
MAHSLRGCQDIAPGVALPLPAGSQLYQQNMTIPAAIVVGTGRGHVYRHVGRGEWYTVEMLNNGIGWRVCTWVGASCPCKASG